MTSFTLHLNPATAGNCYGILKNCSTPLYWLFPYNPFLYMTPEHQIPHWLYPQTDCAFLINTWIPQLHHFSTVNQAAFFAAYLNSRHGSASLPEKSDRIAESQLWTYILWKYIVNFILPVNRLRAWTKSPSPLNYKYIWLIKDLTAYSGRKCL